MTRPARVIEQDLRDAAARLLAAAERVRRAVPALERARGGYPATTLGGGGGGGGAGSPTPPGLEKFLDARGNVDDPARAELHKLDHGAEKILGRATELADIATRWSTPPDKTRARLEAAAAAGEPGCSCCARVGKWSPPHTENPTTVAGNLAVAMLLCGPCYRYVRDHGRTPSTAALRTYHDRGHWPRVKAS